VPPVAARETATSSSHARAETYKCAGAPTRVHGVARQAHRGRGNCPHFFVLEHLSRGAYKGTATAESWRGTC
jgi:hypothetical protein